MKEKTLSLSKKSIKGFGELINEFGKQTKEKTLSDEIFIQPERAGREVVMVSKLKQAIKRLKEDFLNEWIKTNGKTFTLDEIREKINKRLGNKLT